MVTTTLIPTVVLPGFAEATFSASVLSEMAGAFPQYADIPTKFIHWKRPATAFPNLNSISSFMALVHLPSA